MSEATLSLWQKRRPNSLFYFPLGYGALQTFSVGLSSLSLLLPSLHPRAQEAYAGILFKFIVCSIGLGFLPLLRLKVFWRIVLPLASSAFSLQLLLLTHGPPHPLFHFQQSAYAVIWWLTTSSVGAVTVRAFLDYLATYISKYPKAPGSHRGAEGNGDGCAPLLCTSLRAAPRSQGVYLCWRYSRKRLYVSMYRVSFKPAWAFSRGCRLSDSQRQSEDCKRARMCSLRQKQSDDCSPSLCSKGTAPRTRKGTDPRTALSQVHPQCTC